MSLLPQWTGRLEYLPSPTHPFLAEDVEALHPRELPSTDPRHVEWREKVSEAKAAKKHEVRS